MSRDVIEYRLIQLRGAFMNTQKARLQLCSSSASPLNRIQSAISALDWYITRLIWCVKSGGRVAFGGTSVCVIVRGVILLIIQNIVLLIG